MSVHQSKDSLVTVCNAVPKGSVPALPTRCYKPTLSLTHSHTYCLSSKDSFCLEFSLCLAFPCLSLRYYILFEALSCQLLSSSYYALLSNTYTCLFHFLHRTENYMKLFCAFTFFVVVVLFH